MINGAADTDARVITTAAGRHAPPRGPTSVDGLFRLTSVWRKNRGLVTNPALWRLAPRMLAHKGRTAIAGADVLAQPGVMFVGTHHKAMTTYFHAVLRSIALTLSIPFEKIDHQRPQSATRLFVSTQSKLDLAGLGPYRGVHVLRDPRDMIVSGYHYHKWAREPWLLRLDDTGESYQDKLNRLDKTAGLFMEIDHFIFMYRQALLDWNIDDPDMLEVSYESLMAPDRRARYVEIFAHLGFRGGELDLAVDLMTVFEAGSRSGKKAGAVTEKSHLRSGRSRQWEAELEPAHLAYIEDELGPVLRKFGYA